MRTIFLTISALVVSFCDASSRISNVENVRRYGEEPAEIQERSYYNGYGSPSSPSYYPAFDPLSVLASLAFLAFLLQSFASLFDRTRAILPSSIAARESSGLETDEVVKRVLDAFEKYENGEKVDPL